MARRVVGRQAGDGPGQGRALRDRAGKQQPSQSDASLLGGARSDLEGDVDDRRPVQLGGRVLPLPQRQYLAAAVAAADPAGVDDRFERRDRPNGGRARPCRRHAVVVVGGRTDVRGLSPARAGIGLDRRPRPLRLCRGGRRRHDARGGPAPRQSRRRLCSDLAGRGRAVHQPAWLQLARRQYRDAQSGRQTRRLCQGPARQSRRPDHRVDRAIDRERHLLCRVTPDDVYDQIKALTTASAASAIS